MLFLRYPRYPRWFGLYTKSTKMVDYQINLEAWLQDASLFLDEPVDYAINFEDLLSNEKENAEGGKTTLGLTGLGWLDEKVDLSIFDNPIGLLNHSHETYPLIEDDAAFLLGLMDDGLGPSYLPSDALKITDIDLNVCLNSQNFIEPTASEVLDNHLASPGCTTLQVDSPLCLSIQSPAASPSYSAISDAPEESSSNYALQSPEASSVTSDLVIKCLDSPEIRVSVYDSAASPSSSSDEVLSIEDVSTFVRKRKFVSDGENIPKVKVVLKDFPQDPQGAAKATRTAKPKERRERKKVQNKEAAARYRIKKRMEEQEISGIVDGLESDQKKLQEKHDELKSEIKYLKSLMCEILQKKGIMK